MENKKNYPTYHQRLRLKLSVAGCQVYGIVPYFSDYKTEAFPFQNNPKNLDPSYKTDLDL